MPHMRNTISSQWQAIPPPNQLTQLHDLDGHGTYNLTLSLIHAAAGNEVRRWPQQHTHADPLMVGDVIMVPHGVPFPEPGKYGFELRCDGESMSQPSAVR